MMMGTIYRGDIGTRIVLTVRDGSGNVLSLVGATTLQILLMFGASVTVAKTATFVTNGVDGQIVYTLTSADAAVTGAYRVQGRVVIPSGDFRTSITEFVVAEPLL